MQLVENPYVSEFTKKTLSQFGWKEKDPIPAELSDLLLQIKAKLPASNRVDVLVDAAAMSEEDVAGVRALLAQAKQTGADIENKQKLQQETANMSPDVAEAYKKMFAGNNAPEIIDDTQKPEGLPVDDPGPPGEPGPQGEPSKEIPAPQNPEPAAVTSPASTPIAPMPIFPFCPRCGWDMKQKFEVDVTERDKEDFVATLLGGARFKRDYELAGGKLTVRLRSLLADENFLIQRQLLLDQNNSEIFSEAEWFLRFNEYRLVCSLESITDATGKPVFVNPELADVPFTPPKDKPTQTVLSILRPELNTKTLAQEVTRRIVHGYLRRFQRLVEALEAMVLEPSFWSGIEQPR